MECFGCFDFLNEYCRYDCPHSYECEDEYYGDDYSYDWDYSDYYWSNVN